MGWKESDRMNEALLGLRSILRPEKREVKLGCSTALFEIEMGSDCILRPVRLKFFSAREIS
jgi:hypothetical protein